MGKRLPLEGVRVCDLTIVFAGPICTSILADLGAEVIKIENVNARMNSWAHALPAGPKVTVDRPYNRVANFHELNRGKKSITLNLSRPEAREAFWRLVRISDVVVENFSPRVMRNFGFDYESLKAEKPDLVMVSMPAMGGSGPYSNRTGFGPAIDAMSGMCHLTGDPDGPPTKPGHVLGDYNAGMSAAYAVLMALYARRRTGRGQHIDISMREGQTFLIGEYLVDASMNHRSPIRQGNRDSSMAPHGVYPCRGDDEWVAIAIGSDAEWQRLRQVIGCPEWSGDSRYTTVPGRYHHQAEIDARLADWTRLHTSREVMERLQAAGVTAGAVMNGREMATDPHYNARHIVECVPTEEAGSLSLVRPGFTLTRTPAQLRAAPSFAQHTDEVLGDLLGFSTEEIEHMEQVKATSRVPVQP